MSRSGLVWRALGVSILLALVHTWPLSMAPWRHSLNYHADAQLNGWIISWIAHALPTAPAHLPPTARREWPMSVRWATAAMSAAR